MTTSIPGIDAGRMGDRHAHEADRDLIIVPGVRADRSEPLESGGTSPSSPSTRRGATVTGRLEKGAAARAGDAARPRNAARQNLPPRAEGRAVRFPLMETAMWQTFFEVSGLGREDLSSASPACCRLGLALPAPASAEIKIGFQAPLTGFAATDGKVRQDRRRNGDRGNQCRRRRAGTEAGARHL
jgi:hypothetical protein